MSRQAVAIEIQRIFEQNELDDLNRFLRKRSCLNSTNQFLMYMFHALQSAGILTTTVAAGYGRTDFIWMGVALNVIATLVNVYEKTNNSLLKKLMIDIQAIKDGNYVDESPLIDPDRKFTMLSHKEKNELLVPLTQDKEEKEEE